MASLLVAGSRLVGTDISQRPRQRLRSRLAETRAGPPESETDAKQLPPRPRTDKGLADLLSYAEIEEWQQQGSDHIKTGYRRANGSVRQCLASLAYWHNETVNVYSHILGALLFVALLPAYFYSSSSSSSSSSSPAPSRYALATRADTLACTTYLAGVALCFALSTGFHALAAHSERLYLAGMRLDVQGVLVLMWAATVPLVHFTFAPPCSSDDASPRTSYLYYIYHAASAAACSAATLLPRLSGPRLGPHRAALFAAFGVGSFAVPVAHGALVHGLRGEAERVGLRWILLTGVLNGVGAGVYALKFPERWFPQRFDLLGASHQLMHVFVVAAAVAYTFAVVHAFDYRHSQEGLCT